MKTVEEVLVGHIGIDAGVCWIGDPCYVMGDDASNRVHEWSDFCDKIESMTSHAEPLGKGTGIVVSTGSSPVAPTKFMS